MTDQFSTPDEYGNELKSSDLQSSLGESLAAQARESFTSLDLFHRFRTDVAGGFDPNAWNDVGVGTPDQQVALQQAREREVAAIPDTQMDDARARVKQEGLDGHLKLPDQPSIKSPVLDLMIQDAHDKRDRDLAIARGPQGFIPGALGMVTSLGAGMIDPLNMAAFSVPVLGEARWGKMLASAGDSIFARAGVRALQGGVQGAVGTAALQPVDWWLHTQDGQDYTMADALKSIAMGAGMGAAFHAGFGAVGDLRAKARGAPLPGSPEDLLLRGLMTGTHVPGEALTEEGVPLDQVPGISAGAAHPAEAIADLPQAAHEDAFKATVADITADRPARTGEMLDIAAGHDPRIAESIEAFHGSPHDFERFDVGKIGEGEGAQSYGHGLYMAESPSVAESYRTAVTSGNVPAAAHKAPSDILTRHAENLGELSVSNSIAPSSDYRLELLGSVRENDRHQIFDIHGPDRKHLGDMEVKIDGDVATVVTIKAARGPASLGPRVLRELMRQFQEIHPEVTQIVGNRVSGARFGGERVPDQRGIPAAVALSHGERAADAAQDPRWRELADVPAPHSTPEAMSESQAADAVAEPASTTPKADTALEAAAKEAEEAWHKVEGSYTEEERASVNDALAKLNLDSKSRADLITDGAACLAAAAATEAA